MIKRFHAQPERTREPLDARTGEIPEVLRRGHQPPMRASEPRIGRGEVAGRDHDDAAIVEVAGAQRERLLRARQGLDHIEQDDDNELAEARPIALRGHSPGPPPTPPSGTVPGNPWR